MEEIYKACHHLDISICLQNESVTVQGVKKDVYLAQDTIYELLRQCHRKIWMEDETEIRFPEGGC